MAPESYPCPTIVQGNLRFFSLPVPITTYSQFYFYVIIIYRNPEHACGKYHSDFGNIKTKSFLLLFQAMQTRQRNQTLFRDNLDKGTKIVLFTCTLALFAAVLLLILQFFVFHNKISAITER
jgi:hypothetical protein